MRRPRWLYIALARKMSLLFGAAVLLTIIATLTFPWLQMTKLHTQTLLLQAQRIASVARRTVDLRTPDWRAAERELRARWPALSRDLGLPRIDPGPAGEPAGQRALVTLVAVDRAHVSQTGVGAGFQRDAVRAFTRHTDQRYFWRLQRDGQLFRLAMAIRGADTDAHPHVLQGIIDVRLVVPEGEGVWNAVVTVLAGASGAVLAILLFYMVVQRLVLSPVKALRGVAERVTKGDIEVRSSISSGDEFQALSEAFDDMLTHLRAAQEEQRKINRSLDITLGELAERNVGLYESNRLKSEFLSNVTHELRTPLVSIIGFAELLRDAWTNPRADEKRLARYTENILTSGRSLLDIINDLLDLAKIEAGKMELHIIDFAIDELCRDLIDFVLPLADKRNQTLTSDIADELPPFKSDSGKIKQILYNLLSNAIKFTPTGGSIRLRVHADDDGFVTMAVSDTGPGIPEAQQATIFEKFRQLDASTTREYEGTGLGLAITNDLVQILGGTVTVESTVGQGTTFRVRLPRTAPHRDAERPRISLT
ncbi:MAG: ATP-binding protein [Phycisphaerae bacterium]